MRRTLLLRAAFAFEGEKWRPVTALRCAVGVAIPIVLASLSGHPAWGILASTGALNAGLVSFSGVFRSRLKLMLGASVMMGAVSVLGLSVGQSSLALTLSAALLSFVLVVYGSLSAAALMISIQGTMVFLVLSGLALPTELAWPGGGLVLAGGLLQTLLLTLIWPVSPHFPERRAVARVYRRLERLLSGLPQQGDVLADPAPFQEAWDVLNDAGRLAWRGEHAQLRRALRTAEGLRSALVGYARADRDCRAQGEAAGAQARQMARALLAALRQVEREVSHGAASLSPEVCLELGSALNALSIPATQSLRQWAELMVRLLSDLAVLSGVDLQDGAPLQSVTPPSAWTRLRAQLVSSVQAASPRRLLGRHALKYALAIGLSTWLTRALNVPHGYWLVLTVGVVLRQDYLSTLTRGVARLGGTLVGVLAASLLIWLLRPSPELLGLLSLGAAWLTFAVFPASYAAFSAAITGYVVCSLEASGLSGAQIAEWRLSLTLLGGAAALAAYLIWPAWPSAQLGSALQGAAQAQVDYIGALSQLWRGGSLEQAGLARSQARVLRVQAEKVLHAAHLEPRLAKRRPDVPALAEADAALMQLNANAAWSLSLHARSLHRVPAHAAAVQAELEAAGAAALALCQRVNAAGGRSER